MGYHINLFIWLQISYQKTMTTPRESNLRNIRLPRSITLKLSSWFVLLLYQNVDIISSPCYSILTNMKLLTQIKVKTGKFEKEKLDQIKTSGLSGNCCFGKVKRSNCCFGLIRILKSTRRQFKLEKKRNQQIEGHNWSRIQVLRRC